MDNKNQSMTVNILSLILITTVAIVSVIHISIVAITFDKNDKVS